MTINGSAPKVIDKNLKTAFNFCCASTNQTVYNRLNIEVIGFAVEDLQFFRIK